MVELRDHHNGLFPGVALEHVQQGGVAVDALRQRHRQAGPEADEVQVLNGAQPCQIAFDDAVGIHERVAAGDEDIPHLLVLRNIGDGLVRNTVELVLRQPYHALSEAVAAVHRALIRREQQDRRSVFVLQALQFGV